MTKDKTINFRFTSERQKSMVFSLIRELTQKECSTKIIKTMVLKMFNFEVIPHERTVENWIKNQSCKFSKKWQHEQALVEKWKQEYTKPKEILTPEEIQLEEMCLMQKSHSASNL